MKTSYFGRANSAAFKNSDRNFVSIARSCRYWSGKSYPKLFPTWEMIKMNDYDEYRKAYYDGVLNKLDALEVYEELGEDAILLCHESEERLNNGDFCHRRIVAEWLEENLFWEAGIEIKIEELRNEKEDLKKSLKSKQMRMF